MFSINKMTHPATPTPSAPPLLIPLDPLPITLG